VNLKLFPETFSIFTTLHALNVAFWAIVLIFPSVYFETCETGHSWISHIVFFCYSVIAFAFETHYSLKIVKIIEPLSGHPRLSNMQLLKVASGPLGRLDMYTDFCFVTLAFSCQSIYAPASLAVIALVAIVLLITQIRAARSNDVMYFQLAEFPTLFDLLGKYQLMYVEGEKTSQHKREWAKMSSVLPCIKFFCEDIGQFIIQILFLLEFGNLNTLVMISLSVSFSFSMISVVLVYLKYQIFKPDTALEQEFLRQVTEAIHQGREGEVYKLLSDKDKFRHCEQDTRAEILREAAYCDYEMFKYIVSEFLMKNDAIMQSEIFHEKLLRSLRNCRVPPTNLIKTFNWLGRERAIFVDANKRIKVSSEGTILHCLVQDSAFMLRTLTSHDIDLVKFVVMLGVDVNLSDKFGETAVTLLARLNINELIRSCSSKTLKELFDLNTIRMSREGVDTAIKSWSARIVDFLMLQGANLSACNKKDMSVMEIAENAGNLELVRMLEGLARSQAIN
jgi:hypothetical protein